MSIDTYTRVYFSTIAAVVVIVATLCIAVHVHHTRAASHDRAQFQKELTHAMECDAKGWSEFMCDVTR